MVGSVLFVSLVAANVLGVAMIVPQAMRLHRSGVVDGVSPAWIGVSGALNAWWIVYALASGLWALLPVSLGALALYLAMTYRYVKVTGRAGLGPIVLGAGSLGVMPVLALIAAGWDGAGLAIGLAYAVQFTPAVAAAVRARVVTGVSAATWIMAFAEAVIWFGYGLATGSPALLVGGFGGAVMAAIIVGQVHKKRPIEEVPATRRRWALLSTA